jgi:hypothetical protein
MSPESFNDAKNNLANTLQLALYLSPPERKMLQAICSIRDADPNAFMQYIRQTDQQHLALITDGYTIARMLGIDSLVDIRWNKAQQTVTVVSVRERPAPRTFDTPRSYSRVAATTTPTAILSRNETRRPASQRREEPSPKPVRVPTPPPPAEPETKDVPPAETKHAADPPKPVAGRRERPRGGKKLKEKTAAIPLMSEQLTASLAAALAPPPPSTDVNTELRSASWD